MATIPHLGLFSWREIEASSDLDRLRLVLSVLPDEPFMRSLEKRRGRGRDDYPIRPMWNATIAGIVFQHATAESLLRELSRNGELRELCGFDPFLGASAVPTKDAFSRFLTLVIQHQEKIQEIFDGLLTELGEELADLGEKLAVDSKAIWSFGRPVRDEKKREDEDRRRELDADWGTKTYRGQRKDGSQWEKVKRWFGFKLHLLVDSRNELPLAFEVTEASRGDSPELLPLVEDLKHRQPEIASRGQELSADKGYDSIANNELLYDEHGTIPVIDKKRTWQDGEETKMVFEDRLDRIVYDEDGRLYCVCPQTGQHRELCFHGFESERGCLKYRCPAAAYGFECKGRGECESSARVGRFGRVIRVPLATDRRIFTPIARSTRRWKKAYARRTAVERVNSRVDGVFGFERHTIRGLAKMKARLTLAMVVMLAMALGRIRSNQAELLRSVTAPVRLAA